MAIYAKFEGAPGESAAKGHEKWIDLQSMSHHIVRTSSHTNSGGSAQGNTTFGDFSASFLLDSSCPKLAEFCANGANVKTVEIHDTANHDKADRTYKTIKLANVLITSYSESSSGGASAARPHISITFSFEKIDVDYKPTKTDGALDGSIPFKFDVRKKA